MTSHTVHTLYSVGIELRHVAVVEQVPSEGFMTQLLHDCQAVLTGCELCQSSRSL